MKTHKLKKLKLKKCMALLAAGVIITGTPLVCGTPAFADYTREEYRKMASKSIPLKEVTEKNCKKYIKPEQAAYGFNKGECRRNYLKHEEHFYGRHYDHWNADVVYDKTVIKMKYTDFEKARPVVYAGIKGSTVTLRWGSIRTSSSYRIYRKSGRGNWRKIGTVRKGVCIYTDKSRKKAGINYSYRVQGIKKVRYWKVMTKKSVAVRVKNNS